MISIGRFFIIVITAVIILTSIVSTIHLLRNKGKIDKLGLISSLVKFYILLVLVVITMLIPESTRYKDGKVITSNEITKVENKGLGKYLVKTKSDDYKIRRILACDNTFLSLDCKKINKNYYGFEIYYEEDTLFLNKAQKGMSQSEKNHTLDRVIPK